ncbi:MAG TPA: hypothetical protein VN456_01620 [Desulfosporosinus sp.]|nr:hypothetical protein [Desulfosporosinus sp.]
MKIKTVILDPAGCLKNCTRVRFLRQAKEKTLTLAGNAAVLSLRRVE